MTGKRTAHVHSIIIRYRIMNITAKKTSFLINLGFLIPVLSMCVILGSWDTASAQESIDRNALVNRHNVEISEFDSLNSLSVGNGEFAFTVGATGLQSFPEFYENGMSLGTQSQWGWHSFPNTGDYTMEDVAEYYTTDDGREVPYATQHVPGEQQRPRTG